ncbi:DUF421 domain-containing protein [Nocardia sp. NPDC004068]|uniref:DUF421 domain-containing protein n=1 Tax=Nocardia sp. NPDC004068 TaxID=3364303 RepID=UPI0036A39D3A
MIDWEALFAPQTPPLEMVLRGTVMYLTLFALLRVVLKRETGATGMTDLLVAVIVGWSYLLNYAAYRWHWAARLIRPEPLRLVRDGRLLRRNMRQELITEAELLGKLREQGIDDLTDVHQAWMESDGQISLITHSRDQHARRRRPEL